MTRKLKPVYPDFSNTTLNEDRRVLQECFDDLCSQEAIRKVGIDVGNDKSMVCYMQDLYIIKEMCKKYPNNAKVVRMLQDNMYHVGMAIHGTPNMEAVAIASDFLTDMGKILTSGNVSAKNQFCLAYGLSRAVDYSGYNIHTKLRGTFAEGEDTLLGIVLKSRSFPCMAALSEMLECRFVKVNIGGLDLSPSALDGVFFALHGNNGIDIYTKKTASKMLSTANKISEGGDMYEYMGYASQNSFSSGKQNER